MAEFSDEDFQEIVEDFLAESAEMIEGMDRDLVALESAPGDLDLLHGVFRAVHTIKGTSDFLHLSALTNLAHALEDVLDPLRSGTLTLTPALMDRILEGVDGLKAMLQDVGAGREHTLDAGALCDTLRSFAPSGKKPESPPEPAPAGAEERAEESGTGPAPLPGRRPKDLTDEQHREIFGDFIEESRASLSDADRLRESAAGGDGKALDGLYRTAHTIKGTARFLGLDAMASLAEALEAFLDARRKRGVPLGVEDASLLETALEALASRVAQAEAGEAGEPDADLAARLKAAVSADRPAEAEAAPPAPEAPKKPASRPAPSAETSEASIRVDTTRLDELMNLVGEMVLGRNRLVQAVRSAESKKDVESALASLEETADFIDMITSDLQKAVIKTRMQQVGRIFNKFPRLVRDLSREKEKAVRLEIRGADTELDKSVIDEIGDPLVHLVRNAVDHGIESPEGREAAGKPREGTLVLAARQEGNRIAIEVSDDGRGLDTGRIRAKALERGLITSKEAESLPENEIRTLIFAPGFSTAETVDRTSGRGVGMDVVKSNIEKLGGFVELDSTAGKGTRFVVKLPLTLAIIPVLMVRVSTEVFALPAVSVIETVRVQPDEVKTIDGKEVINLRGKILPLLRITDLFGLERRGEENGARRYVVVAGLAEKRVGLLIHGLIGQEEAVIKPLGDIFEDTAGIAGATIRGDGKVALILDFASLVKLSPVSRERAPAPRAPARRFPGPPAPSGSVHARPSVLSVLVVDDSATERKIVRQAVEAVGHRAVEASDGTSALARLGEADFDIVITDIEMEGMDGLALAQRIRAVPRLKSLPVVALSTHGKMVDRIRGSEAGLDAYLSKPLDRDQLQRTLQRLCGR